MCLKILEITIIAFRKIYRLCPSHCLSAPALTWDAMLNITKVELELISDADMYFVLWKMFESWSFLHF